MPSLHQTGIKALVPWFLLSHSNSLWLFEFGQLIQEEIVHNLTQENVDKYTVNDLNEDHECHCHDDEHECHCHDDKHECHCHKEDKQ